MVNEPITVRSLDPSEIVRLRDIDRSEHIERLYAVRRGELISSNVDIDVPPWDPEGTGDHSVTAMIDYWRPKVEAGAVLLGAFANGEFCGLAVVDEVFEPGIAWLGLLHVTRVHRRRGVASALWNAAVRLARAVDAGRMYVSATPSDSAVGFYLRQGCTLSDPPHPGLFALEPEDVHLVCSISGR